MKKYFWFSVVLACIFSASASYAQCTSEITGSSTYCSGSSTTLTANLLTGTGTIDSYQWKKGGIDIPGATNSTYQANEAANYKVSIKTKSPDCTAVSPIFKLTENKSPETEITGNSIICAGGSSVLNSNAVAGSGSITSYQWKLAGNNISNATNDTYNASASGSYTVLVTNSNGCSTTSASFVLNVSSGPNATFAGDTAVCKGFAASLSVNLIGTAPFSILYNDGNNDLTISNIASSTYQIIIAPAVTTTYTLKSVTDADCSSILNDVAVVTVNDRPSATIVSNGNEICFGDTTMLSGSVEANGTWVLKLSSGDTLIGTGNTFDIPVVPLLTNIYSIYSLTDESCFSLPMDLIGKDTVTVLPKLSATITGNSSSICNGEKVFVNGKVTAAGDWTLVISPGGIDTTGSGSMDFSIPVSPNTTTTYFISSLTNSTCTASAEDLTGSSSVIVNSNLSASITSIADTVLCFGDTAYIAGNVVADGPWILNLSPSGTAYGTDTGTFSIAVSPASNTTTTFVIASLKAGSCSAIADSLNGSAEIKVKKKLSAAITTDSTSICNGSSITLIGNVTSPAGTWTIKLSNGDIITGSGTTFNSVVTPSVTTTYTIDSLGFGQCSALQNDLTGQPQITVSSTLSANISSTSDSICKGSLTNIFGSVIAAGNWELEFSSGDIINGTGNSFSLTVAPAVNTNYTITSMKEGACEATSTDLTGSYSVTINPIPVINNLADTTLCNGAQSAVINFGANDTTYHWVNYNPEILTGFGTEGTGDVPGFIAFNSGTTPKIATVTVYPKYQECIGETKTWKLVVNPTPYLNSIVIDTICNNTQFFYKATSATESEFSWIRNSVPGINNNDSQSGIDNVISETLSNNSDSVIRVSYIFTLVTADGLCQNTDTLLVTVNPTPMVNGTTDTTLCNDIPFNYQATSTTINTGVIWERIAADGISPILSADSSNLINDTLHNSTSNPVTVTYQFTLTTADGYCTNVQLLHATINPTPVLSSETTGTICNNILFDYDAESETTAAGYQWVRDFIPGISNSAASANSSNISEVLDNTTANPLDVLYVFTLTTADGLCLNSDTVILKVNPTPHLSSSTVDTVCSDVAFYYNATSATTGAGFSWVREPNADISPFNATGNHQEVYEWLHNSTSDPITVTYNFVITTADDLCSNTESLFVVVNPAPETPSFFSIDSNQFSISLCSGSENINFNVNTPQTDDGITYLWYVSPGEGIEIGDSTNPNTVIAFNNEGTYIVSVIATNPPSLGGCNSIDSQLVIVESDAVDFGERNIILKQPGNLLVYPDNSLSGYQWGYDTMMINGADTILGRPNKIDDQVYQVFVPDSKFISGGQLNVSDYAYWVFMNRDGCESKVYYNGPFAKQKTELTSTSDEDIILNVYPNPNNGSFNILMNGNIYGNITIEIFNLLGAKVFETGIFKNQNQYEGSLSIEKQVLPEGNYLLQFTGSNQEKIFSRIHITNR